MLNGLLFLHAGFAYNDSKLIVSDALTQGLRPVDAGPKLTGTWYINYAPQSKALSGFSLGLGGSHYGKDLMINNTNGSFSTNAYIKHTVTIIKCHSNPFL